LQTALLLLLFFVALMVGSVQYFASKRERAAATAYPPAGLLLNVGGVTVHAEQMGCGPDIVLIHGASWSYAQKLVTA